LDLPELLTIEQVADRFGVKPRFVRSLISRNQIAYKRLGAKTIRITRDALIDYLDKIDVAPPQPAIDDSEYSSLKSTVKRNRSLKSKDETVKGKGDYGDRLSQEMRDQWRS
jgi:excisionase family DNA binding protein